MLPEWLLGIILFSLGIFTAFQAWVGIVLVGLVRDLAVYRAALDNLEQRLEREHAGFSTRLGSLETFVHGRS